MPKSYENWGKNINVSNVRWSWWVKIGDKTIEPASKGGVQKLAILVTSPPPPRQRNLIPFSQ